MAAGVGTTFVYDMTSYFVLRYILYDFRSQVISAGLESVISRIQSCIASFYIQFSTNIETKILLSNSKTQRD